MEQNNLYNKDFLTNLADLLVARLSDQLPLAISDQLDRSDLFDKLESLSLALPSPEESDWIESGDFIEDADRKLCSEPDCNQSARARGLCSKHYQRLRYAEKRAVEEGLPIPTTLTEARSNRSRKPARKTDKRGGGACSIEGCELANYAKGMCGKHFMEWVRAKKKAEE